MIRIRNRTAQATATIPSMSPLRPDDLEGVTVVTSPPEAVISLTRISAPPPTVGWVDDGEPRG